MAKEQLKLKIGAEVMFIKNDIETGRYVNGTRGIVTGFDKREGWPIVKTYDDEIIIAEPQEWKFEDDGIVRATIRQVPLRLAWAITIHKSQGMTLDAAEMDLGDVFEPGMGYVSLSRVRNLNGLKLMNLNELALKVHPKILDHDEIFKGHSENALQYLKSHPEKETLEIQNKILLNRFKGYIESLENAPNEHIGKDGNGYLNRRDKSKIKKSKNSRKLDKLPTHTITEQLLKENLSIESIAEKRGLTADTIIGHIEKLHSLKQIDNNIITSLKNRFDANDFDILSSELINSEDGRLRTIYEKFEGKYSYGEIKLARLVLNNN